jgi:hypothetical protein
MKRLLALLTLGSLVAPQVAIAGYGHPYAGTYEEVCYKDVYRETYVPGNSRRRGYVRYDRDRVQVPCRRARLNTEGIGPWQPTPDYRPTGRVDDNSCIEGAIIGGILGGAATAAGSRGPDMAWAIPLGVVGGSLVGCQVDGG